MDLILPFIKDHIQKIKKHGLKIGDVKLSVSVNTVYFVCSLGF